MSRSVSWRRVCTDELSAIIDKSLQSTLYILKEIGPTGFIIRHGGCDRKFKVLLGDPHSCTCSQFRRTRELCVHILWLVLKKFRVPKDNPLVYQLGLVEREIQEVLCGQLIYQQPKQIDDIPHSTSQDQRPVSVEDVCPICQESLIDRRLSYCKYGCGNSVHLKCIKMWAEHQRSHGELTIVCPLCREKFSTFQELYDELHSKTKRTLMNKVGREALHLGITCGYCHICPIAGKCYKCDRCLNYFLCSNCFNSNQHHDHSFVFKQHPSHTWRTAVRLQTVVQSQTFIDDLQQRELSETDYELLLRLDNVPTNNSLMIGAPSSTTPVVPRHILNSFQAEPLDNDHRLIKLRRACTICSELYQRGDWIRKLPCKHKFHRRCIDQHLCYDLSGNITCPIDGQVVMHDASQEGYNTIKGTLKLGGSIKTTIQHNAREHDSCISVTGHGLLSGKNLLTEMTPPSLTATIGNGTIKRGSLVAPNCPALYKTDLMDLNIQATPISACSNASSERGSELSLNLSKGSVHHSTPRHSKHSLTNLVAKRNSRHDNIFPSVQFNNALSITTVGVHKREKLPPINAHLNKEDV